MPHSFWLAYCTRDIALRSNLEHNFSKYARILFRTQTTYNDELQQVKANADDTSLFGMQTITTLALYHQRRFVCYFSSTYNTTHNSYAEKKSLGVVSQHCCAPTVRSFLIISARRSRSTPLSFQHIRGLFDGES